MALGMWGTAEVAKTAAKPGHLHAISVHLGVRTIIVTTLFKIGYIPWNSGYITINDTSILFILLTNL